MFAACRRARLNRLESNTVRWREGGGKHYEWKLRFAAHFFYYLKDDMRLVTGCDSFLLTVSYIMWLMDHPLILV